MKASIYSYIIVYYTIDFNLFLINFIYMNYCIPLISNFCIKMKKKFFFNLYLYIYI